MIDIVPNFQDGICLCEYKRKAEYLIFQDIPLNVIFLNLLLGMPNFLPYL